MKKIFFTILLLVMSTVVLYSQSTDIEKEKEAITQTALDYMDGALEGNAARIERAAHPELNKVSLRTLKPTGKNVLYKAGYTRLLEIVRANLAFLEKEKRDIKVDIYVVKEGLASVKVVSTLFYDYLLMAKLDGQWKIINVLWRRSPNSSESEKSPEIDPEIEKEAIKKTALDYIEGSFTGDGDRMARALHPELNKVIPVTLKQTGKTMLNYSRAGSLIEGTRAKLGMLDKDKWNIKVKIFDVQKDIAMVEVLSAMYYDYLQVVKMDGEWKIINVLWKMNPDAPKRS